MFSSRRSNPRLWPIPIVGPMLLFALACSEQSAVGVRMQLPSAALVAASVTGRAAASLDANGFFAQADSASQSVYPELTRTQANNLALAWVKQFAALHRSFLTQTRGGSVHFAKLVPCGRGLYAESPFEPPTADWPPPSRRPYGPWWLVTLCSDGVPEVSLAISAWATDLDLEAGKITFPFVSGNEFIAIGIPLGTVGEFPSTPEVAVTLVAQADQRRVQDVPRLFAVSPRDGLPQSARWQLSLESPAVLTGEINGPRNTSEVFVGSKDLFPLSATRQWLALPHQQLSFLVDVHNVPTPGESHQSFLARSVAAQKPVLLRPGFVYQYEAASEGSSK